MDSNIGYIFISHPDTKIKLSQTTAVRVGYTYDII